MLLSSATPSTSFTTNVPHSARWLQFSHLGASLPVTAPFMREPTLRAQIVSTACGHDEPLVGCVKNIQRCAWHVRIRQWRGNGSILKHTSLLKESGFSRVKATQERA